MQCREWILRDVTPVSREGEIKKYNIPLQAGVLAELYNSNVIIYEGEIQRGTKTNARGKEVAVFSTKKVNEILEAMMKGDIHGGMITLNYLKDEDSSPIYNAEEKTITGNRPLQILDGQHRIRACVKWLKIFEENQDTVPNPYEFEYPVTVENLNKKDAMDLFAEYALTPKRISKTRAEYLNVGDIINPIAKYIMRNSELKNKVEIISTSIRAKKNQNIVTFAVLVETIRKYFKPQTRREGDEIAKYLTSYFNILINVFSDEMGEFNSDTRQNTKKTSLLLEPMAWGGYVKIAQGLKDKFDNNEIEEKLNKLKSTIIVDDWQGTIMDRDCPIWTNKIFRDDNKIINNSTTKKLMANTLYDFVVNDKDEKQLLAS